MKNLLLVKAFLFIFIITTATSCAESGDGELGFNEHPSWLRGVVNEFKAEHVDTKIAVWYYKYDTTYYYQLHSSDGTVIYYEKKSGDKIVAGDELYTDISKKGGKLDQLPFS